MAFFKPTIEIKYQTTQMKPAATKKKSRSAKEKKISLGSRIMSLFKKSSIRPRGQGVNKKTLYMGLCMCGMGLVSVAWYQEYPQKAIDSLYNSTLQATAKFGFRVNDIMVQGRQFTSGEKILKAMQLKTGDPIFKLSPQEIRETLKEVPWIEEAHVHRQLPSTIYVKIIERVPIAIWQHQQNHYLVDGQGVIITNENLSQFKKLPVIVGGDAPLHVPKILTILEKFPQVYSQITALVRVGGRRWDIQLNRHITIKLPESNVPEALAKLDKLIKQQKLDLKEITTIDLRIRDKTIMNLSPEGDSRLKGKGSET